MLSKVVMTQGRDRYSHSVSRANYRPFYVNANTKMNVRNMPISVFMVITHLCVAASLNTENMRTWCAIV